MISLQYPPIKCQYKINMATFPYFGENTHYVVKWHLASLGCIQSKCDIEWYDEGTTRTFLWNKPTYKGKKNE